MIDKVPVSDLCNEKNLQPSVFYTWQRQALENLAGAFSTPTDDGPTPPRSSHECTLATDATKL